MNNNYISAIPWIVGISYVVVSAVAEGLMLCKTIKNPADKNDGEPNKSSKKSLDCLVK